MNRRNFALKSFAGAAIVATSGISLLAAPATPSFDFDNPKTGVSFWVQRDGGTKNGVHYIESSLFNIALSPDELYLMRKLKTEYVESIGPVKTPFVLCDAHVRMISHYKLIQAVRGQLDTDNVIGVYCWPEEPAFSFRKHEQT